MINIQTEEVKPNSKGIGQVRSAGQMATERWSSYYRITVRNLRKGAAWQESSRVFYVGRPPALMIDLQLAHFAGTATSVYMHSM
jgi:hypothetical protein